MPANIDRYRPHVEHFDLSDAQKNDLIHIVGDIMQSFVDRAFGDDPVQQCLEGTALKRADVGGDVIDLPVQDAAPDALTETFNHKKGTTPE